MEFKEDLSQIPNQPKTVEIASDDELQVEGDIDLTAKSLKNTRKNFQKKKKKTALPMKSIINKILSKDISKRKYKKSIFTDKKQSIKSVKKERLNNKLKAIKRHLKKKKVNMGRTLPNYNKERDYERNLKMIAVEGLTKLFNAMANIQKESLEEVLKMQLNEKIGKNSRNSWNGKKGNNNRDSGFLSKKF